MMENFNCYVDYEKWFLKEYPHQTPHFAKLGYMDYQKQAIDDLWKNLADQATFIQVLNRKLALLKELMLLTHEQVSHEVVGDVQLRQWAEFIAQFPDEA